ncbi:guanine nucleotide-binding protein subunit alpha [Thoreauomyces humboldtii]|nr:guanine nucleotide-binding protein subunit alpha [Thoreauomyces humboldtii]
MGCFGSKTEESKAKQLSRNKSRQIDVALDREKLAQNNEIKMLLLGAGESGKSTILKQMRLIHDKGFDQEERESFRIIIYKNTVQSMAEILDAMKLMDIPFSDPSVNEPHKTIVQAASADTLTLEVAQLPPAISGAIKSLWADAGVQACYQRRSEYQLNDSAQYYFSAVDRISVAGYMPTDQDVLRSRVKTTGITESTFPIGDLVYRMFDVGGQRSERKKWIHCFEKVTAIVFLVAVSEYDQVLVEDKTVNRMGEALALFDSICNSRWFVKTSIILFLNKIDLFREKLPKSSLANYFPDFKGGADFDAACDYMWRRFKSLNQSTSKEARLFCKVYIHFTCATDTKQIQFVMDVINDIMMQNRLDKLGLM